MAVTNAMQAGAASGQALAAARRAVERAGFDCFGVLDASDLVVRDEVRAMCAADRCRSYGSNWACPPACGDLDFFRAAIASYAKGIAFQTVVQLEDEFDGESMMEAEKTHKRRTDVLAAELEREGLFPDACLLLSAGTCTRCRPCAYPDPCRFPDKRLTSMEAAGLVVTEACEAAGIPYNHGPLTMAYTGCVLVG